MSSGGYTQGAVDGNAKIGVTDILVMLYDVEGEWQWTQQGGEGKGRNPLFLAGRSRGFRAISLFGISKKRQFYWKPPDPVTVDAEKFCSFVQSIEDLVRQLNSSTAEHGCDFFCRSQKKNTLRGEPQARLYGHLVTHFFV